MLARDRRRATKLFLGWCQRYSRLGVSDKIQRFLSNLREVGADPIKLDPDRPLLFALGNGHRLRREQFTLQPRDLDLKYGDSALS